MLTADLVTARRRGDKLLLARLKPEQRRRADIVARQYLALAAAHLGRSRAEFDQSCARVEVAPRERRLAAGLLKLVRDRCRFEMVAERDPSLLRQTVFRIASETRQSLPTGTRFDRQALLEQAASELGLDLALLEQQLYADLRGAHRLTAFDRLASTELVASYDRCQVQAVLLRATSIVVEVQCSAARSYRHLFRKLKFLRLLHRIQTRPAGGFRIEIDGPYSLFRSVTKYGLQLALLLPTLEQCEGFALEASVRWGKSRTPLSFQHHGGGNSTGDHAPLPDEVAALQQQFSGTDSDWQVMRADEVLDVPGVGVCVPDLVFRHQPSGFSVRFEVLGYWSREALWKRVEMVERGLTAPVLFAASDRLRVSEQALEQTSARLYIYKGSISRAAVLERLEHLRRAKPG